MWRPAKYHPILIAFAFGAAACSCRAADSFDYGRQIGFISSLDGGHLFSIDNPSIRPGTRIKLCSVHTETPIYMVIKGRYQHPEGDNRLIIQSSLNPRSEKDLVTYRVESEYADISAIQGEVGVIGTETNKVESLNCNDLNSDGIPDYYTNCTSREGLHSFIRSGNKKTGKIRWHIYYYFGYEVEGNCTASDFQ